MEWPHGVISVFTSNVPKFGLCISEASTLYLTKETIYIGKIPHESFYVQELAKFPKVFA